jgi:hypothetical protein
MTAEYVPGADTSEWQGRIDFNKFKAAGLEHVSIRLCINGRVDHTAYSMVNAARAAGVNVVCGNAGISNPKAQASAEMQGGQLATIAKDLEIQECWLDVESYANEPGTRKPPDNGEPYYQWIRRQSDAYAQIAGRRPIIYTSRGWWRSAANGGDMSDHELVVAWWPYQTSQYVDTAFSPSPPVDQWDEIMFRKAPQGPGLPPGFNSWSGWQISAGGNRQAPRFGCVGTDLDLDIFKREAVDRWLGVVHPPVDPTHPIHVPQGATEMMTIGVPVMNDGARPSTRLAVTWQVAPNGQRFGSAMSWINWEEWQTLINWSIQEEELNEAQLGRIPLAGEEPRESNYDWTNFKFNRLR